MRIKGNYFVPFFDGLPSKKGTKFLPFLPILGGQGLGDGGVYSIWTMINTEC